MEEDRADGACALDIAVVQQLVVLKLILKLIIVKKMLMQMPAALTKPKMNMVQTDAEIMIIAPVIEHALTLTGAKEQVIVLLLLQLLQLVEIILETIIMMIVTLAILHCQMV